MSHINNAFMSILNKKVKDEKSFYNKWLELGNKGTKKEFMDLTRNMTPYEFWKEMGNNGTEEDFINSNR